MRKLVGMLAFFLALLFAISNVSIAGEDHPRKYGLELSIGGGFYAMEDINDFIPADFVNYTPDKINIGSQFGVGIIYRHMENFGWQIGYNSLAAGVPIAFKHKYEVRAYLPGAPTESWAEQTVSGWELYFLATWYKPTDAGELMFGFGPTLCKAVLDRSIDIVRDASGSHLTGGSFADAKGKTLGWLAMLGYEFPLGETTALTLQVGGRLAEIKELTYDDPNSVSGEQKVYKNAATGSLMAVDFSGAFAKITLRAYFKPATTWREH